MMLDRHGSIMTHSRSALRMGIKHWRVYLKRRLIKSEYVAKGKMVLIYRECSH